MVHRRGNVLFLRMTLAIAFVVGAAFAVNTLLSLLVGRASLERLSEENLALRTETVRQAIAAHLAHCAQEVAVWSALDILDDISSGDRVPSVEDLLLSLKREHSDYHGFSVIDRHGRLVASTDVERIGEAGVSHRLPRRGIGLLQSGELPLPDAGPEAALTLAHPIRSRRDTAPGGWLVAHARWDRVDEIVAAAAARPDGTAISEDFFVVLDAAGRLVAGEPPATAAIEEEAWLRLAVPGVREVALGPDATYVVAGSAASPPEIGVPAFRVIGLWRETRAHAAIRPFVGAVLASGLLGLLIATGVGLVISRLVTRRIARLTRGTERLAEGDLQHRVEDAHEDELGELARSFNRMVSRLADAQAEIELSAARWQSLVQQAPDLIMTVSLEGEILFANRGWPLALASAGDRSIYSYLPGRFREALRAALSSVRRTRASAGLELQATGPEGARWYDLRVGPIVQDERLTAFTVIATDVTDRKALERELLEISELERKRIGCDLHDGLGQVLTGASLLARSVEQRLDGASPVAAREVAEVRGLIVDAISQTRGIARGLFPVELDRSGLAAALEGMAHRVEQIADVRCAFETAGPVTDPASGPALHLYRIAQEAVNNSLRHSGARRITIELAREADGACLLRVEDDGVGISATRERRHGMGLRMMDHRASVIGAAVSVRPRDGGGTVVECRF